MAAYCAKCFEELNPTDSRDNYTDFLQCQHCNQKYHAIHWTGVCSQCGHSDTKRLIIDGPEPFKYANESQISNPGSSTGKIRLVFSEELDLVPKPIAIPEPPPERRFVSVAQWARLIVQIGICTIVVILLVGLGTVVGMLLPHVIAARPSGIQGILNAITRQSLPTAATLISALTGSLGAAMIFFHQDFYTKRGNSLTRFFSALTLIIMVQIIAYREIADGLKAFLSQQQFVLPNDLSPWIAVGGGYLTTMLLTPAYRSFGLINGLPKRGQHVGIMLYNLLRFVIVVIVLLVAACSFTLLFNNSVELAFRAMDIRFTQSSVTTNAGLLAVLVSCIGTSFALFTPSVESGIRRFGCVRFIVVVAAIFVTLVLYGRAENSASYLSLVATAIVSTIALVPVQRSYS